MWLLIASSDKYYGEVFVDELKVIKWKNNYYYEPRSTKYFRFGSFTSWKFFFQCYFIFSDYFQLKMMQTTTTKKKLFKTEITRRFVYLINFTIQIQNKNGFQQIKVNFSLLFYTFESQFVMYENWIRLINSNHQYFNIPSYF